MRALSRDPGTLWNHWFLAILSLSVENFSLRPGGHLTPCKSVAPRSANENGREFSRTFNEFKIFKMSALERPDTSSYNKLYKKVSDSSWLSSYSWVFPDSCGEAVPTSDVSWPRMVSVATATCSCVSCMAMEKGVKNGDGVEKRPIQAGVAKGFIGLRAECEDAFLLL